MLIVATMSKEQQFMSLDPPPYHHHNEPIMAQPMGMGVVGIPINVPPGLEYLTRLNQIFVKQHVEPLEGNLIKLSNNFGKTFNNYFIEDA